MPLKAYRGFNTGNSLKKIHRGSFYKEDSNEGYFTVSDNRQPLASATFDDYDIDYNVIYSTKKKRRWMLSQTLRQSIIDEEFEDDRVQIIECEKSNPFKVRTRTVAFKAAGEDKELRVIGSKQGFVNERSVMKTLEKEEGETDPQAERQLTFEIMAPCPRRRMTMVPFSSRDQKSKAVTGPQKFSLDFDSPEDLDAIAEEARMQVQLDREERASVSSPVRSAPLSECIVSTTEKSKKKSSRRSRVRKSEELVGRKDRKVFCPLDTGGEALSEADTWMELDTTPAMCLEDPIAMVPVRKAFVCSETEPTMLRKSFGDNYLESLSMPRKFAIRLPLFAEDVDNTDVAFLVFEEAHDGDKDGLWDVFFNADVTSVQRLSLDEMSTCSSDNDLDLRDFVRECSDFARESFLERFTTRDVTLVVNFAKKLTPLRYQEPVVQPYPSGALWQEEVFRQNQYSFENSDGSQEMMVVVNPTCEVCFEPVTISTDLCVVNDSVAEDAPVAGCCLLKCGHNFCNTCWQQHLTCSIRQGQLSLLCPASDCQESVDVVTALRFISLPIYALHARLRESDGLLRDRSIVLCPNRNCGRAIRVKQPPTNSYALNVSCVCGYNFCFSCREEAHWPATCHMYRLFKTKMMNRGDWNVNDVLSKDVFVEGKPCPSCKRFIEKNGGCPCMVCVCKTIFCWQCSKLMSEHGNVQCSANVKKVKAAGLQNVKVFTSKLTPSPQRSRLYCQALKYRLMRLQSSQTQKLHLRKVHQALYKDKVNSSSRPAFDASLSAQVLIEARGVIHNHKQLLRIVEFCFVSAFAIKQSHEVQRRTILDSGMTLLRLHNDIREVISGRRQPHVKIPLLQDYFRQARDTLRILRTLSVFTDTREVTTRLS